MNKKILMMMVLVLLSFSVTAGFWDDFFGKNVAGSAIEDCEGFWDCWFNGGENLVGSAVDNPVDKIAEGDEFSISDSFRSGSIKDRLTNPDRYRLRADEFGTEFLEKRVVIEGRESWIIERTGTLSAREYVEAKGDTKSALTIHGAIDHSFDLPKPSSKPTSSPRLTGEGLSGNVPLTPGQANRMIWSTPPSGENPGLLEIDGNKYKAKMGLYGLEIEIGDSGSGDYEELEVNGKKIQLDPSLSANSVVPRQLVQKAPLQKFEVTYKNANDVDVTVLVTAVDQEAAEIVIGEAGGVVTNIIDGTSSGAQPFVSPSVAAPPSAPVTAPATAPPPPPTATAPPPSPPATKPKAPVASSVSGTTKFQQAWINVNCPLGECPSGTTCIGTISRGKCIADGSAGSKTITAFQTDWILSNCGSNGKGCPSTCIGTISGGVCGVDSGGSKTNTALRSYGTTPHKSIPAAGTIGALKRGDKITIEGNIYDVVELRDLDNGKVGIITDDGELISGGWGRGDRLDIFGVAITATGTISNSLEFTAFTGDRAELTKAVQDFNVNPRIIIESEDKIIVRGDDGKSHLTVRKNGDAFYEMLGPNGRRDLLLALKNEKGSSTQINSIRHKRLEKLRDDGLKSKEREAYAELLTKQLKKVGLFTDDSIKSNEDDLDLVVARAKTMNDLVDPKYVDYPDQFKVGSWDVLTNRQQAHFGDNFENYDAFMKKNKGVKMTHADYDSEKDKAVFGGETYYHRPDSGGGDFVREEKLFGYFDALKIDSPVTDDVLEDRLTISNVRVTEELKVATESDQVMSFRARSNDASSAEVIQWAQIAGYSTSSDFIKAAKEYDKKRPITEKAFGSDGKLIKGKVILVGTGDEDSAYRPLSDLGATPSEIKSSETKIYHPILSEEGKIQFRYVDGQWQERIVDGSEDEPEWTNSFVADAYFDNNQLVAAPTHDNGGVTITSEFLKSEGYVSGVNFFVDPVSGKPKMAVLGTDDSRDLIVLDDGTIAIKGTIGSTPLTDEQWDELYKGSPEALWALQHERLKIINPQYAVTLAQQDVERAQLAQQEARTQTLRVLESERATATLDFQDKDSKYEVAKSARVELERNLKKNQDDLSKARENLVNAESENENFDDDTNEKLRSANTNLQNALKTEISQLEDSASEINNAIDSAKEKEETTKKVRDDVAEKLREIQVRQGVARTNVGLQPLTQQSPAPITSADYDVAIDAMLSTLDSKFLAVTTAENNLADATEALANAKPTDANYVNILKNKEDADKAVEDAKEALEQAIDDADDQAEVIEDTDFGDEDALNNKRIAKERAASRVFEQADAAAQAAIREQEAVTTTVNQMRNLASNLKEGDVGDVDTLKKSFSDAGVTLDNQLDDGKLSKEEVAALKSQLESSAAKKEKDAAKKVADVKGKADLARAKFELVKESNGNTWVGGTAQRYVYGLLTQTPRFKALSNAIFQNEDWYQDIRETVEQDWAPLYLGQYFTALACNDNFDIEPSTGAGAAFVESPSGALHSVASIQAEKSPSDNQYVVCHEEDPCVEGVCKDGLCYADIDAPEPLTGRFYKITWGVSAPQDVAFTTLSDESRQEVDFNLALYESTSDIAKVKKYIFKYPSSNRGDANTLHLGFGNNSRSLEGVSPVIVDFSSKNWQKVCIVWGNNRIKTRFLGEIEDVCAHFVESTLGTVNFQNGITGSGTSAQSTSRTGVYGGLD